MKFIAFAVIILISLMGCSDSKNQESVVASINFGAVQDYALQNLDSVQIHLRQIPAYTNDPSSMRYHFHEARKYYKRIESFAQYVNAEAAHHVNGPPLPIYREDNGKIKDPVGLQALSENVYGEILDSVQMAYQVGITKGYLDLIKYDLSRVPMTPRRYFVSIQRQLLSVISVSITGFDTPSSLEGILEAAESLDAILRIYDLSIGDSLKNVNSVVDQKLRSTIHNATAYLIKNSDFDSFDRYAFIKNYFNPITRSWLEVRKSSGLWEDDHKFTINLDAPTFFEENTFNIDQFRASTSRNPDAKIIDLGKQLFFESRLAEKGDMSCSTCHQPEKAYTDGLRVPLDNEGNPLSRNTPTLINSIYQRKFFWDGRSDNLEQQITNVFQNDREFNAGVHQISTAILSDTVYQRQFNEAYGRIAENNRDIINALAGYVSTLNGFNSKFDRNMKDEETTFSTEEINGMNLFMGKALCATCHFVPLFNGTVPPLMAETEKEILGTPLTASNDEIDTDVGFYTVFKADIHKYMFKTPTIRNIELTSPYMHNGVYETLEQVMEFYNVGGGAGLGFEVDYQTLPFDSLQLSDTEIENVIAFMKTLSGPVSKP